MADVSLEGILEQVKALPPEEQRGLRDLLDELLDDTPSESKEDELERRLLEAGVLSKIPPPVADLASYQNREPGETSGRPLSEIIIEERR